MPFFFSLCLNMPFFFFLPSSEAILFSMLFFGLKLMCPLIFSGDEESNDEWASYRD